MEDGLMVEGTMVGTIMVNTITKILTIIRIVQLAARIVPNIHTTRIRTLRIALYIIIRIRACYPYYNYSPNYCVNSPYCSPYTASQYPLRHHNPAVYSASHYSEHNRHAIGHSNSDTHNSSHAGSSD